MRTANYRRRTVVRFNVDDPADLRSVTVSGAIWRTPYARRAVDAIEAGAIRLEDCRDVPEGIAAHLRG